MEKNKELLLSIVEFFIENPFDEDCLGVSQKSWRLFFQANFPELDLDIEDFDFFEKIKPILLPREEELTPNIPPNLAELVELWEKEKAKGEKEKAIKRTLADDIKAAQKAINDQWEISRPDYLIEKDIKPEIERLQKEVVNRVQGYSRQLEALLDTSEQISQALSEIPEKKLIKTIEENKLKEEVLKPVIIRGLELKGEVLSEREEEKVEAVAAELFDDKEIQDNFKQQLGLFKLKKSLEKRKEYLKKKAADPDYEPTELKEQEEILYPETAALGQTREFVAASLDLVKPNLQKLGFLEKTQVNQLIDEITLFINQTIFKNPTLASRSDQWFVQNLQRASKHAFGYYLRQPAITGFLSALRNSIPGLRTEKAIAAKEAVDQLTPKLEKLPPQLISAAKAAALTNYGLAEDSIEAGSPLGQIPAYIYRYISGRLPEELVLGQDPEEFVKWFQEHWQKQYEDEITKKISQSKRTAIKEYVKFLQRFREINPAGYKLFRLYQRHFINIAWGKAMAGFLIRSPDYILHFPYIFGKYWVQTRLSQWWEWTGKPKVIGGIIKKVPGVGHVLGFLYKKDEWGLYEGPIDRIKKKVKTFILQKGLRKTGKLVWKIGKKLGIKTLRRLGVKIFAGGLTGGLGTLFFAFYPFFKKTLKRIAKVFGAIAFGILLWAKTYGAGAVIGWGVGAVGGIYPAVKVGGIVWGATFGFLGPFAIIPSVIAGGLTWLGAQALGAGLGILFTKIWLGIKGVFSSLFAGPGAAGLAGPSLISQITAVLPKLATPVLGIAGSVVVGGSLLTHLITSSAFVIPAGVGRVTPYGECGLIGVTNKNGGTELARLFIDAGQWAGVPPAVLAGVAAIEGAHLWDYTDDEILQYSASGAKDPINCSPNACGARGPMQFLAGEGGNINECPQACEEIDEKTGECIVWADIWSMFKNAVNQALPHEQRTPHVCNIKDSVYAAALKLKQDSGTSAENSCNWTKDDVYRATKAYYGGCLTPVPGIPNYCEFVWEYYLAHSVYEPIVPTGAFFWQSDPRWRDYGWPEDKCTIGTAGCGPTSLAMVFISFDVLTDPVKMWDEFVTEGFIERDVCLSKHAAFTEIPKKHGFESIFLGTDWDEAGEYLTNGYLLIAATDLHGGHILVVVKIEGDTVITFDPASSNGEGKPYTKTGLKLSGGFWAIKK